jgi:hypothetical protein
MMKHRIGAAFGVIFLICILFVWAGCAPVFMQTALAGFPNAASAKSAHSLTLSLSLDTTVYRPGQYLSIVINEQNTLSRTNHVTGPGKWALIGLTLSVCGTEYYPFGILITRGNYTVSNISKAAPLSFFDPDEIVRGCIPEPISRSYEIAPLSDNITDAYGSTSGDPALKCALNVDGYWAKDSASDAYPTFHTFEPGTYTAAAGDEWGALVILHFTVTK